MKLHIVQLLSPLSLPNRPVLFLDQAAAEGYFVQLVQENYGTSYSEFCNQEGLDEDDYSSALAFKETLEPDENEVQYWTTDLQLAGAKGQIFCFTLDALSFKRQREMVLELTTEAEPEKFSSSRHQVLDGLTNLLDAIADQAHDVYGMDVLLTDTQREGREAGDAPLELTFEQYVESIKKKFDCGPDGKWGEFTFFPKSDWQEEVSAGNTRRGYWEHVAANIGQCIQSAGDAGYTVYEDPDHEGFYFNTPEGEGSDVAYASEEEAWCHASSHLDDN